MSIKLKTAMCAAGMLICTYAALALAPYLETGIVFMAENAAQALASPSEIILCDSSLRCVLIFNLGYVIVIAASDANRHNFRRGEEHGSARWESVQTLKDRYAEKGITKNVILTQNVAISLNTRKHMRNLNILVCGGSGAGKTRFYAKPNIMNANCSMVILDPKGELLRDTGYLLEQKGYKLKILDLINMDRSDCYNPFMYLRDDNDIQRMVTNLFANTTPKDSKSSDPFWDQAGMMLLLSLVFYLHYEFPVEEQNFSKVLDLIRLGEVDEENSGHKSKLDMLFDDLENKAPEHTALKYYRNYRTGAGKTLKSIQITLLARLEKFNLSTLSAITSYDEMELDTIGEEKTAVFAIIPDNDTSFNFIVGMLYTQLFQQLYYQADIVHEGRLPIHVHFIMDEFANVALPESFDKLLATMRSREISVSIIIQNLAQLKKLFPKEWESITGNCDEFLFLGGNEQSTFEYVSKLLGKETVEMNTFNTSSGKNGHYTKNMSLASRELMMPDEVRVMDNKDALLFIRGERAVKDRKYDIMHHPNIKLTADGGMEKYLHGMDTRSYASIGYEDLNEYEKNGNERNIKYTCMTSAEYFALQRENRE